MTGRATSMSIRSKSLLKFLLRASVTAALLIWAFRQVDFVEFRQAVQTAKWQYVIAVWLLTVALFWLRSIKMQVVLRRQDCHVRSGLIFGATVMTALYSLVLPGILSTGVKWYVLRKDTGRGSQVFSGMVYNQLSTMVVMTVFGLGALMLTDPAVLFPNASLSSWVLPVICGILLAGVVVFVVLLLNTKTAGAAIKVSAWLLRPLPPAMRTKAESVLGQIVTFQNAGLRFHSLVASMTVVDTLIGGAVTYMLAAGAAGATAPVTVFVWLCAMLYVLGRLPISIANLGVRESLMVVLLSLYGVQKPAALLVSMVLFSALVFVALLGAAYQIAWSMQGQQSKS